MLIGVLTIQIHLHAIFSLKDKRKIVKSLVERLRSRFNASVSEISAQDSKQLAIVGVSVVANDGSHLNEQLDKIITFIVNDGRFVTGRVQRETFTCDHDLPYGA
ncbi:MAG: DUF503 domain-containing protein [Planctomycetaceae bacterium]|nr:DUF503 domain-containing protein [Planctomycetaceae bacterium]